MNTKIVAIVAALVVVVGGTSIFIITNDDNDKNLPTQHYVGPSVYTYNTAVVDSEKNISAPLSINGISSLSEDKISDAVSNMYMGTKNNTMYFRIASLPNSVTAILSATYGGSGGTMSFTHQTTSAISTSVEESISNTISETIASEFNFETSKGISESITASVSASVEAGLEFPIVSAKATKTVGLSNTIGASLETTCGWSDSVSSQESKTFCNSYAQTVTTTYGSGAEWKDIATKFGCFYRIAEVTTVHVVEAIEFEYNKVSESFVVKDITYLTIFENKPAIYLQEGDSIDFINTSRSDTNCSLTKEEIEYASSEYESYLVKNSEDCTITFYADANGNEILSSEHYIKGAPIPETSIPKYEDDRFIGWTNEANGNKIVEVDKIATTDVSYYPVLIEDGFKKISTYDELVLIENDLNGKYILIPKFPNLELHPRSSIF